MAWTDHAIWWHLYPLGFAGAPIRTPDGPGEHHRLRALIPWLDYAVSLGTNGLLLGPVFASSSHGYDTLDHLRIDPRLGDEDDLAALVAACRERGLRVLLDGVFNHVGEHHPDVRRALAEGPNGPLADRFRIDWDAPGGPRTTAFEGHGQLVTLNHDSDAVAGWVASIMTHWLDRGIDGWRLDAAYAVPTSFWVRVLPRVRSSHPEAWMLGEVIHGDLAAFVATSGVDSVTQYPLWKAAWSSLLDRNFFELDHALQGHNRLLDTFTPQTFVGNHDVTRIATRVGPRGAALAATVLLTVGGVPSIYAGDEQGFTGLKEDREGGDDAVRPPFPSSPSELVPDGEWLHRWYQDLVGLRRRHPWLVTARTRAVQLTNQRYVYEAVEQAGPGRLTVTLDVAGEPFAQVRGMNDEVLLTLA